LPQRPRLPFSAPLKLTANDRELNGRVCEQGPPAGRHLVDSALGQLNVLGLHVEGRIDLYLLGRAPDHRRRALLALQPRLELHTHDSGGVRAKDKLGRELALLLCGPRGIARDAQCVFRN